MKTYTEQEATANLQKIVQLLTDGTLAARKLAKPLDAASRSEALTVALRPFEAATITGTTGGLSIYGAAKLHPAFGTPEEYAILKEYGMAWRRALIDFVKAWRDLLQARENTAEAINILKQLEYGIEDCIEGCKKWTDENGEPTGENAPGKYFAILQQFKIQVADILDNQPIAETATNFKVKILLNEEDQQLANRWLAARKIIDNYLANNRPGKITGLPTVLKALLKSKSSELVIALQGCKVQKGKNPFKWTDNEKKRVQCVKDKFTGWIENRKLIWPPDLQERIKNYQTIAHRNNKNNKNKINETEGKNV
jgi:hypothetical protein